MSEHERMWVNAVIGEIKAKLEVIRCKNMRQRGSTETAKDELFELFSESLERLDFRPFTAQRRSKAQQGDLTTD